jgi:hypothetical protein
MPLAVQVSILHTCEEADARLRMLSLDIASATF